MNFKQAILTIALVGIVAPAAHAITMKNTSTTRGFWLTISTRARGVQTYSGCIAPGKSYYQPTGDSSNVRVEVTTSADCSGTVMCDTDMQTGTSAPLSVYPQAGGGCYIDRMADNGNSPTYKDSKPDTGDSTTINNISQSRGYWVTTYKVDYGMKFQQDHGCVQPGQQVTFDRSDVIKIEVTSDPYCKQQVLCGTDTYNHSAPISVYRNQNGCYIDYTINHEGEGGYQKQSAK